MFAIQCLIASLYRTQNHRLLVLECDRSAKENGQTSFLVRKKSSRVIRHLKE